MKSFTSCRIWHLLIALTILLGGCVKPKLDNTIPLLGVGNSSASAIRLYNYYGSVNVTVNNIPLTAYGAGTGNGSPGGTPLGLSLFPTGLWQSKDDASPFVLPNSLLDKAGNAHFVLTLGSRNGSAGGVPVVFDTTIANDVQQPKDYYLLPDGHLKVMQRDNIPSSDARNFKIRIINEGEAYDPLNLGLTGPVTLTYADGSPVSQTLSNVAPGVSTSYIELPYGAYQFKLFIAGAPIDVTRQLAEIPVLPLYDGCKTGPFPQEGLSPRVRTFKPGGVYSIVITYNYQDFFTDCTPHYDRGTFLNSYRIITELDPGVNYVFARVQAVNALPGQPVTIKMDGKPVAGQTSIPYVGSFPAGAAIQPPYDIAVQGNHHVTAEDASGNVLASEDLFLYPYDNYTIWTWPKPDGKAGILFEANDMTGTLYSSTFHPDGVSGGVIPDDGTDGTARRTRYIYALESRFLNLSPDLSYATFTNDGQLLLPATSNTFGDTARPLTGYVNLAPGMMPDRNSSILYSLVPQSPSEANTPAAGNSESSALPRLIRVNQSSPAPLPEIPGTVLPDVAPIDVLQGFIANQAMYTTSTLRQAETGVYTVALVGKTAAGAQGTDKAKLVVIKHNK